MARPERLHAEFADPASALAAARQMRNLGGTVCGLYGPYDVPGADELLELPRPRAIPRTVAAGGAFGALGAYLVQWYVTAVSYPVNVGGRPPHAVPAFVPVTFEIGVLGASLAALLALVVAARLGRLWQPIFEIEGFERATTDRFWLAVEPPRGGGERMRRALLAAGALRVVPTEEAP